LARRERTADRRHVEGDPQLAGHTHHLPTIGPDLSAPVLRICVLAEAFLDHVDSRFDEDRFVAFLQGAQEVGDLTLGEIWAARPALQLAALALLPKDVAEGRFKPSTRSEAGIALLKDDSWVTIRACNLGQSFEGITPRMRSSAAGPTCIHRPTISSSGRTRS
jgi:hypothetical protein